MQQSESAPISAVLLSVYLRHSLATRAGMLTACRQFSGIPVHLDEWPFPDPPEVDVLTTIQAVEQEKIMFVMHGESDGEAPAKWQFHNGETARFEDLVMISLEDMTILDPSLMELATLPPGWIAMRKHPESTWNCYRSDRLGNLGSSPIQIACCIND